jgi:hypothetical protein
MIDWRHRQERETMPKSIGAHCVEAKAIVKSIEGRCGTEIDIEHAAPVGLERLPS